MKALPHGALKGFKGKMTFTILPPFRQKSRKDHFKGKPKGSWNPNAKGKLNAIEDDDTNL